VTLELVAVHAQPLNESHSAHFFFVEPAPDFTQFGTPARLVSGREKCLFLVSEQSDTLRVKVAVTYRTDAWQTIEIDLGSASGQRIADERGGEVDLDQDQ
jgi:hypothetical protein